MQEIREVQIENLSSDELRDFRDFLRQNSIQVDQLNNVSPGYQREPLLIAIIVALGGPVIVREFVSLAKQWIKLRHERKMAKMKIIATLAGGGKQEMNISEIEELSKHL